MGIIISSQHYILLLLLFFKKTGNLFTGVGLVTLEDSKVKACEKQLKEENPGLYFHWSAADKSTTDAIQKNSEDSPSLEYVIKLEGPDAKGEFNKLMAAKLNK